MESAANAVTGRMRRIVRLALNLTYFSVEFSVALAISSVSLNSHNP
jgi:hypothetical protein